MKDLSILASEIKQKVEKLIAKQNLLKQRNDNLEQEIINFKNEVANKSQQILQLEEKIKVLKIVGSVDSESAKEVKLKINEMVREVDKCIAQINR